MLQKTPSIVGRGHRRIPTGAADLVVVNTEFTGVNASIEVSSPAFDYGERIPAKYTADGEGLSPPIEWSRTPPNAEAIVLLIEDPDTYPQAAMGEVDAAAARPPHPFVHALVWDLPGRDASLPEGALPSAMHAASAHALRRSSRLSTTYVPPDPPPGDGRHRYVIQVLALDMAPRFEAPPGRETLMQKIAGHVIAKGLLIGVYQRP